MATANAAATLKRAQDFATDFAGCSLVIRQGTTTLASHTIATFTTANSGNDATATANGTPNVVVISASGTADNAQLVQAGKIYDLTLGTSGTDVVVSTTNYIAGEDSTVNSLVVTVPSV